MDAEDSRGVAVLHCGHLRRLRNFLRSLVDGEQMRVVVECERREGGGGGGGGGGVPPGRQTVRGLRCSIESQLYVHELLGSRSSGHLT